MKFTIERDSLLKPLQKLCGLLNSRLTVPILNNLLIKVDKGILCIVSTNLEMEIVARIKLLYHYEVGVTTVAARKIFNICRGFPDKSEITMSLVNNRFFIHSGYSRFILSTLPASNFPNFESWSKIIECTILKTTMKYLIEKTQFSMAHQDVRYYLNGMLFEIGGTELRTVAADGHRLAICSTPITFNLPNYSVIIPRKSIIELLHMLDDKEESLCMQIGTHNIRFHIGDFIFTSKLINDKFPSYHSIIYMNANKTLKVDRVVLKQAFNRVAILSDEKVYGVRLIINDNQLKIIANNKEQEEAEEVLDVIYYYGEPIEICFNVNYIIDVLNTIKCKYVIIQLLDSMSSIQIRDDINQHNNEIYVIMPMRL